MKSTLSGLLGYVSQSFIHQTKPKTSYFNRLKYEPDMSTQAREKWGVKILMDLRTPCSRQMDTFYTTSKSLGITSVSFSVSGPFSGAFSGPF